MILRQTDNNAKSSPFVAVFEPYHEGEKSIQTISKIAGSENFVCIAVESTSNTQQIILNAIDEKTHKPGKGLIFEGVFGIASERDGAFEYLYLGRGKRLQKGDYRIEAVGEAVSAELRRVDGQLYYSADGPVKIGFKEGRVREYPAGYHVTVN